jgi:glucose/arabinose dehydrogenase
MKRPLALVVVALVLTACAHVDPSADKKVEGSGTPAPEPSSSPSPSPSATPSPAVSAKPKVIGTIADHLAVPWGIAFLPDGTALVTERDSGRVLHNVGRQVTRVGTID